jgi:hypothetical protein
VAGARDWRLSVSRCSLRYFCPNDSMTDAVDLSLGRGYDFPGNCLSRQPASTGKTPKSCVMALRGDMSAAKQYLRYADRQSEVNMATVTIELPDTVIRDLAPSSAEVSRRVLEAVVLEGYRSARYSRGEVAQLLGLSWHATERFLAEHGLPYDFTLQDLDEDRETLDRVG